MNKKYFYFIFTLFAFYVLAKSYKYIPYRVSFLGHYDKIWSHRNNSIEKANTSIKYFKGIELDLVYSNKEDYLDVNHPPTKSINLHFETFVNSLLKKPFLWLDIKNLNTENSKLIADKIINICKKNNYPLHKILIESTKPNSLLVFTKLGFKTSYYLNPKIHSMNKTDLENEMQKIKDILHNQPKIAISFNYNNYNNVVDYFPNKNKYTWIIDGPRQRDFKTANKVLNDTTVKVVLIRFKTIKGHR